MHRNFNQLVAVVAAGTAVAVGGVACERPAPPEYCDSPRALSPYYTGDGQLVDDRNTSTWLHGAQLTLDVNHPPHGTTLITGYETGEPDPTGPAVRWHDSQPLPLLQGDEKVTLSLLIGAKGVAFSVFLHGVCGAGNLATPPVMRASDTLPIAEAKATGWPPVWH